MWYKHGKLHRENGPAVVKPDGTIKYYINNQLHRDNGPAVIRPDGQQIWYCRGRYHRIDGPAIILPNSTHLGCGNCAHNPSIAKWYKHGKLHREDGPAWVSNDKVHWFWNGKNLPFIEYWEKVKKGPNANKVMAYILGSKQND